MFSLHSVIDYVIANIGQLTLFVLFISLIRHILHSLKLRKHLPPGPTCLPVVGYLPFLGKEPHKDIAKLSDKYGNVFTLQLGIRNVVVLNNWEAVRDAFHKDAFLGRPTGAFALVRKITSLSEMNGNQWKDQRRFALQVFRDLGFGKGSMEDRIIDEISHLLKVIDQSKGQPIDIHAILTPSMSNNICHLVFGHRYETDDPRRSALDKILDQTSGLFSQVGFLITAPIWFTKLILKIGLFNNKKLFEYVFSIFDEELERHQKNFKENVKRDYIDGYLAEMQIRQKKDPDTNFTVEVLQANCRAFFGAGSETVRTTTEWCLLLAAHFSEHQKRIHEEIDSAIGIERSPAWADRLHMPFIQAFINEMFRWKNTIPLNVMRRALEDSSILGHFIPKDTYILANLWAVHNDPKIWDNPREFNPNRFLSDDGKDLIKTETLIPFSLGKRSCVGEGLARVEVFLYVTTILQNYEIRAPEGTTISFEDKFGLSLQPKHNSRLLFNKRF